MTQPTSSDTASEVEVKADQDEAEAKAKQTKVEQQKVKAVVTAARKAKRRQKLTDGVQQYNVLMEKHVVARKMVPLLVVLWSTFAVVNTFATDSIGSYMLGISTMILTMFLSRAWPAKNLRAQNRKRAEQAQQEGNRVEQSIACRKGIRMGKSL